MMLRISSHNNDTTVKLKETDARLQPLQQILNGIVY